MSTTRRSIAEDLQGSRPAASISLTGAGVTRSAKAIRIRHNHAERLFHAEIASFCDLGPEQKGVHMSRFEETVNEAIDEVVIGEALRIEVRTFVDTTLTNFVDVLDKVLVSVRRGRDRLHGRHDMEELGEHVRAQDSEPAADLDLPGTL